MIPAFNAERTVAAAVDSVLEQSFEDFELTVIDDGSSDGTAEVVRSRGDRRVSCVTIPNGGVARARNHGVALSHGALVAFLDADDLWYPTKLERQHEMMASKAGVGLCYTSTELVDDELAPIDQQHAAEYPDYVQALLLLGNIVTGSASSVLVRRSLLEAAGGFDPLLSQCADWDLWLRLSLETGFAPVSQPLVRYRKAPDTMSSDPALLERDTFALLDKFYAAPRPVQYRRLRSRVYSNHWMVCSGTYLHAGRIRDSLRCLARGLAADPRNLARPLLLPARRVVRRSGGPDRSLIGAKRLSG